MRVPLTWLAGVICLLFSTIGCAAGSQAYYGGMAESMPAEPPAVMPDPGSAIGGEHGLRSSTDGLLAASGKDQNQLAKKDGPSASGRKVVYTAWFTVDVYEIREAQAKLVALANSMGGYMQETRGPVVVIRVPAEQFEKIEPELRKVGRVDDAATNIRATDITAQFVDTELRLKTKKNYLNTLTKMLESAGTLKDKLDVQKEIARLVEEIESLEGRLRLMAQQISLATVTVTFRLAHSGPKRTFRLPWGWLDRLGIENLIR